MYKRLFGLVWIALVFWGSIVRAQGLMPVQEVARLVLALQPGESTELLYGFAPGDSVGLLVAERDSDRIGSVEVFEYPTTPRLAERDAHRIVLGWVSPRKQIYRIRIVGHARRSRTVHVILTRRPAREGTVGFNTTVYFRSRIDSSAAGELERISEQITDTTLVPVMDRKIRLGARYTSRTAAQGAVVPLTLPGGTLSWSMYIGVGEAGAKAYQDGKDRFVSAAASAASAIPGYGLLAALALHGVNYIDKALVHGDAIRYALYAREADAQAALSAKPTLTKPLAEGSSAAEALAFPKPRQKQYWLVLRSTNWLEPQDVWVAAESVQLRVRTSATVRKKTVGKVVQEAYLAD